MSFASDTRELRRDDLTMLETHIVMSSLIFCLDLILVLCLVLILVICLSSLMDLTITQMVLVNKRTVLYIDALDMTHILIMVIISHVCLLFPAGGFHTRFESRHLDDPHFFPIVVLVPLVQTVMCKDCEDFFWLHG
jgi:hypothetical protein